MCAVIHTIFEEWEAAGAKGWGYRDCLPYFKKAETWIKGVMIIAVEMARSVSALAMR